jgi:putative transposase
VHAELRLGRGILVGHNAVALLMRQLVRLGTGEVAVDQVGGDLVGLGMAPLAPAGGAGEAGAWVTEITEHPTREGKVSCAVVLDAFLPPGGRLVDRRLPDRGAGAHALGMAIDRRTPPTGAIIHSDQGYRVNASGRRNTSRVRSCDGSKEALGG